MLMHFTKINTKLKKVICTSNHTISSVSRISKLEQVFQRLTKLYELIGRVSASISGQGEIQAMSKMSARIIC